MKKFRLYNFISKIVINYGEGDLDDCYLIFPEIQGEIFLLSFDDPSRNLLFRYNKGNLVLDGVNSFKTVYFKKVSDAFRLTSLRYFPDLIYPIRILIGSQNGRLMNYIGDDWIGRVYL